MGATRYFAIKFCYKFKNIDTFCFIKDTKYLKIISNYEYTEFFNYMILLIKIKD
jgi:hypothetical protein